jgi:hypothetical protein
MGSWHDIQDRAIRDAPFTAVGVWTPERVRRDERYFGGEPTGDPDACEMGEHGPTIMGRCKFCGEAVL